MTRLSDESYEVPRVQKTVRRRNANTRDKCFDTVIWKYQSNQLRSMASLGVAGKK